MLSDRLEQLISELFVPDTRSIKLFGGEILESLDMDLAREAVDAGKPIPASSYTKFDGFVRRLRADPERTTRLHNFDVYLSATIARLMDTRDYFFVALWRADSAGGPYINFTKKADKYEVTLMSNYRKLEKREEWFAAALSLFEWYAADTGFLGVKLFRKSWSLDIDPVEIASAISLVVTYVLDALASGYSLIQIPHLQDDVFEGQYRKGQLAPVIDDASMGWRLIESANSKGFHPPVSQYRAGMDPLISQHNLRDAIDIASENDDEIGMYSLGQLLEDVQKREALFKPVHDKLREFVELSHNIRSRRVLPVDHPAYEDEEDDYEDYEDESLEPTTSPVTAPSSSPASAPAWDAAPVPAEAPESDNNRKVDEQDDVDAPQINEGTSQALWDLVNVFEGKVKVTADNSYDQEFLLACLLGSYLREITGFDNLHDVRYFYPAFEQREKLNGPAFILLTDGGPVRTVLNNMGIYGGVTKRFQERAAKVFETLLQIKSIEEHATRLMFINDLPDQTLMDCKIWSMVKNKGGLRNQQLRTVVTLINQIASFPRL